MKTPQAYEIQKNIKHIKDALGHLRHVDLTMLSRVEEPHVDLSKRHLEMWEVERKELCKTSELEN